MSHRKSDQAALLAFIAGATIAAGAALLLTPKSGREVREKIGEATDGALEKLKLCVSGATYKLKPRKTDPLNYDGGDCWI